MHRHKPDLKVTDGPIEHLNEVKIFYISAAYDEGKQVDRIIAEELTKQIPGFQRYGFSEGVYVEIDYGIGEMACIDCAEFYTRERRAYATIEIRTQCDLLAVAHWEQTHNGSPEEMAREFARSFVYFYQKYRNVEPSFAVPPCECECCNIHLSYPPIEEDHR